MSEPAIGAVLAGGASRRMGRPKATVTLGGTTLLARAVAAVEAAGLEPVAVAKRSSILPPLDCRTIVEPEEPRHPLTGIVAALRASPGRCVVAVGCDMPFVPPALLSALATLGDALAIVVELDGELEPLLAGYSPAAAEALAIALDEGLPLREAVASLEPRRLGEDELRRFGDPERIAFNVNSPADLERARALLSHPRDRPRP